MTESDSDAADAEARYVDQEIAKGRVDANGLAFAGSQLQVALYVNEAQLDLNHAITDALPELADAAIEWVSPLRKERYTEYRDGAALDKLGLKEHRPALRQFWPPGGPRWDALARVQLADAPGLILVEGKSYPAELRAGGAGATADTSIALIRRSLEETRQWLNVSADVSLDVWLGPLYQSANRLAHLYFFRETLCVQAWLAHLLFINDPRTPTTKAQWKPALQQAENELGVATGVDGYTHIFLPALPRMAAQRP